ncbi:hypothetical protein QZH41_016396 [Actinostola sp. cb2023]|nr:hypothetical protein QZH41_016396 [Actinostola sp. cb2023]
MKVLKKSFLILSMDDFHNINVVKMPTERVLTNAVHMVTMLMDIQPSVQAVPLPLVPDIVHRNVIVTIPGQRPQICRGGICSDAVIQEMQKFWPDYCGQSFLESLPQPFKDVDPHTMQQSLKELRVYTREDREECQTIKSTVLIDEVEKSLHSKNDYHDCHQYIFEVIPEFQHFLKLNVAPTVGDWPTWYFQKKIVCHAPQGLEVLSLIPELGQFHVYLNSSEDVVKLYNPVFKEIYTAVFGERVRLAEKPKPDKVALCLVLGFCGWQRIRAQVRQAFGNCKDVEYVCLNHLFEELIPLCYLHYPVIVKGGNMVLLQKAMKRLALMFVAMDRHHYNKACLSWISDNEHQKENFPQYHQAKTKLCSVLTEKKVEIFHSTLRSRIKKTDNGDKIQETARLIARSNFDNDGFEQSYVPNYQRGYSDQDLMLLSGLASEGILSIFERVALNLGSSHLQPRPTNRAGKPYGKSPYYLATFKIDFSTKSLPIGYRWPSSCPEPQLDCDAQACRHPLTAEIRRLMCGHTFHIPCMSDEHGNILGCSICLSNLITDVTKLSYSWNVGLLSGLNDDDNDGDGDGDDAGDDGGDSGNQMKPTTSKKDVKYFESEEFDKYIQEIITSIVGLVKGKLKNNHEE